MRERFDPIMQAELVRRGIGEAEPLSRDFWIQRHEQKLGIAMAGSIAIERFFEDPDVDERLFTRSVLEEVMEAHPAEYQESIVKSTLHECFDRRRKIAKLRDKYPDDRDLFRAIFRYQSMGRQREEGIQATLRPLTIHFRMDLPLYQKLWNREGFDSGGFFNRSMPEVTFAKGLHSSETTLVHEETHAIYHLMRNILSKALKKSIFQPRAPSEEDLFRRMKTDFEGSLDAFLRARLFADGDRIKDEIFAFTRQATRNRQSISSSLTRKSQDKGLYDYYAWDLKRLKESLGGRLQGEERVRALAFVETRFPVMHKQLVNDALKTLHVMMENKGLDTMTAFFYLVDIPLEKWSQELEWF